MPRVLELENVAILLLALPDKCSTQSSKAVCAVLRTLLSWQHSVKWLSWLKFNTLASICAAFLFAYSTSLCVDKGLIINKLRAQLGRGRLSYDTDFGLRCSWRTFRRKSTKGTFVCSSGGHNSSLVRCCSRFLYRTTTISAPTSRLSRSQAVGEERQKIVRET